MNRWLTLEISHLNLLAIASLHSRQVRLESGDRHQSTENPIGGQSHHGGEASPAPDATLEAKQPAHTLGSYVATTRGDGACVQEYAEVLSTLGVDSKADLHLVDEDDLVEEVSASNQSTRPTRIAQDEARMCVVSGHGQD